MYGFTDGRGLTSVSHGGGCTLAESVYLKTMNDSSFLQTEGECGITQTDYSLIFCNACTDHCGDVACGLVIEVLCEQGENGCASDSFKLSNITEHESIDPTIVTGGTDNAKEETREILVGCYESGYHCDAMSALSCTTDVACQQVGTIPLVDVGKQVQ